MPRPGRPLELLVAQLEGALGGTGLVVKSPDRLKGRDSGIEREIDVSIRSAVGFSEVLVIFECRDRRGPAGVEWIEQLASKRRDVGASHAVAVAARFTNAATNTAKQHGIDLRTLTTLDAAEIGKWFALQAITLRTRHFNPVHFGFLPAEGAPVPPSYPTTSSRNSTQLQEPELLRLDTGTTMSLMDAWAMVPQDDVYALVPADGSKVLVRINMDLRDTKVKVAVHGEGVVTPLECILMLMELWVETRQLPPTAAHVYARTEGVLAHTVEFIAPTAAAPLSISVHRNAASGEQTITVRPKVT